MLIQSACYIVPYTSVRMAGNRFKSMCTEDVCNFTKQCNLMEIAMGQFTVFISSFSMARNSSQSMINVIM